MSKFEDLGFASMVGDRASATVGIGVVLGVGLMGVLMKGFAPMSLTHTTEHPHWGLRPMRAVVLSNDSSGLVVRYQDGSVRHISYDPTKDVVKWRGGAEREMWRSPKILPFTPRDLRKFRRGAEITMLKPEQVGFSYGVHGNVGGEEIVGREFTPEGAADDAASQYADAVEAAIKEDQRSRG